MLGEYAFSKLMDSFFERCGRAFQGSEAFRSLDFALELAMKSYGDKFGKDEFYGMLFDYHTSDLSELRRTLKDAAPTREGLSDLLGFFSELTGMEPDSEQLSAFGALFLFELLNTEEYQTFAATLRRDFESGAIYADVKRIKKQVCSRDPIPHLLTASPSKVDSQKFLHREQELKDLRTVIEQGGKVILVNGLGGIGKTAVARSLYHELKDRYRYAAWVDYSGSLRESLLAQIRIEVQEANQEVRFKQIESFFTNEKDVLLLVDNLGKTLSEDDSLGLLTSIDATVVVTSRMPGIEHFRMYPINQMSKDQCVNIFYRYYPYDKERVKEETVKKLVSLADCHTLTVELLAKAAGIVQYRKLDVFLSDLESKGFGYPSCAFLTDHTAREATLAEHLVILFELVDLNDEQQRILKNFAWLPSMVLPAQIETWLHCDSRDMKALVRLGWIQEREDGYEMPDIVREAVRLQTIICLEDCGQVLYSICEESFFSDKDTYLEYKVKTKLVEGYIVIYREQLRAIETVAFIKLLAQTGRGYSRQGNYRRSYNIYREALEISIRLNGERHILTGALYNNIALVCKDNGDYRNALNFCQKALSIRKELLEAEHPELANTYDNMALIYSALGKNAAALEFHQKAIAIQERAFGPTFLSTAFSYNNIACCYRALGDYEKALEFHMKALTIREESLGPEHPETASSYNNLAFICLIQKEYAAALALYQKALLISETWLGREHPHTAATYNNIAFAYIGQKNHIKALEFLKKALEISEKILGPEHPDTASTYHNIAMVYHFQKKYDLALEYYQKALKVRKEILGMENEKTAMTCYNMGDIYEEQGKFQKALSLYLELYQAMSSHYGAQHTNTLTVVKIMETCYIKMSVEKPFKDWLEDKLRTMGFQLL